MSVTLEQAVEAHVVPRADGTEQAVQGEPLLTVEEFLALCERPEYQDQQLELDEGRLIVMPPAGVRHGGGCWLIAAVLADYVRGVGRGMAVTNDAGLMLAVTPSTIRAPDIAFYRDKRRLEELSEGVASELPQLVVEVLSPSDRPNDVARKVQQYLRAGIEMVWVVEPQDRTVAVYRRGREPQVLGENETLSGEDVLPGFSVPVADLFRLPGTQPLAKPAEPSQGQS
ncbi:MAG: Uma2 family endonuclease [Gemmatales bacterium]|nr:Uma2 family endonuclease [Gemmatales bacterium]MDW8223422.1 Uma2 family endonuclease [Gemmatales bacterium]